MEPERWEDFLEEVEFIFLVSREKKVAGRACAKVLSPRRTCFTWGKNNLLWMRGDGCGWRWQGQAMQSSGDFSRKYCGKPLSSVVWGVT